MSDELASRFDGTIRAIVALELRDAPHGQGAWTIDVAARAEVRRGSPANPSFRLRIHFEDFRDLIEGAATVRACLIDGRLEIEGDLGKAMALLPQIFSASAR